MNKFSRNYSNSYLFQFFVSLIMRYHVQSIGQMNQNTQLIFFLIYIIHYSLVRSVSAVSVEKPSVNPNWLILNVLLWSKKLNILYFKHFFIIIARLAWIYNNLCLFISIFYTGTTIDSLHYLGTIPVNKI